MNNISFEVSGYQFIINKNNDYYIVEILDGKILDWIDNLNMYSINKKPSCDKLIDKIKKKLNVQNISITYLCETENKIVDKITNPNIVNEIKIYQEIDRLKTLWEENKLHENNKNKLIKKVFNDNTIRDIIINEYIKNWQLNNNIICVNIANNIYIWDVIYNLNFKIHMKILFDSNYFPYAPPQIQFISPKLCDKLDHRISNCKIFKLDYWNPLLHISEIIIKIKDILMKYGMNDTIKSDKKINYELYQKLIVLTSYISDDDTDIINTYFAEFLNTTSHKIYENKNSKTIKLTSDKFNGIGYRYGEINSNWKIEDYENLQKTKEFELISVLTGIATDIDKINKDELHDTIENSLLIKFLVDIFNNTSLLDISKRLELFKICFNITQNICIDTMINLIFNEKINLFNAIKKLYDNAKLSAKFDQNNEIITQIIFIWSLLEPLYEQYITELSKKETNIMSDTKIDDRFDIKYNINKSDYKSILSEIRFDTANIIISNYKNSYLTLLKTGKTNIQCMKRLSTEIPTLANDLPIHEDASIFLRVDENNPRAMRALITGPPDTPYDSGIFIFDIYLPPDYPVGVPMINFTNTGGKRFNPNLYNCGKVCLSILGTYIGPTASQAEKWNTSSTLYQVLISIQGQILVEHPYFNEPGYQQHYKTPTGNKKTEEYNKNIRLYTMQHAMLDLLEDNNMYPEFKDVIINHFKLKKNKIIDICTKWFMLNNATKNIKDKIINKLKEL